MNTGEPLAFATPEHPPLPPGLTPLEPTDPPWIGPYSLVGRIGAGGMGAVYGALDVYGRCVAVKAVHADLAGRPGFREAFAREVAMLARAQGVSTARLHAHDTEAEVPWLAFDFVPGRDLRAHVREFGTLSGAMLRVFALGVAEGLAALHAAGVAHRDIKPGNVILSPQGPKIVDFGIAVEIGTERSQDAAATYGTPGWAAPERHEGAAADPSADVFAWGGLVALAATGREPFGAGETRERIRRVRSGEYEVDGVPDDLRGLVESALAVDPAERPAAEALVRALLPEDEEGNGTHGVAETLRRMLGAYWRGVDDAGHDPARWAGALAAASTVGLGASALGGGAGSAAGVLGMAAGGSPAAVAGTFGGTSTGGVMGGLAGSKLAMTGAGLLAVAAIAGGGYLVYQQVRTSPTEWATAAAQTLEEGAGFTATVERLPVDGGEAINEEYLYSATDQSFLIRGAVMGPGTSAVAEHQGELYVYAPREEDPGLWSNSPQRLNVVSAGVDPLFGQEGEHGLWRGSPEHLEPALDVDADSVAPTLITAPLRSLAEMGGAEEVEGREGVFEGPTFLPILDEGVVNEAEAVGRVEVDEAGAPVWAEYTTQDWEVRVDFEEIVTQEAETGVPMEDPQVWAADNDGFGWSVVHAPICGTVDLPQGAANEGGQKEWDVQASGWDVDCDQAMEVARLRQDRLSDPERVETLHAYRGRSSDISQYDGEMACGIFWSEDGVGADGYPMVSYTYGPCQESTVLSLGEETDPYKESEVEFGPVTLIDFHERT